MKILLSAFAFAPNVGSEPGVGWRWAIELACHHQVVVVTDVTRRNLVESCGQPISSNLTIRYFRPKWLQWVPLNSTTAQLLYTAWQFSLLGFARQLHQEHRFDIAMHITYGVFRHPSFLGWLNIPFLFGPLGGGEDVTLRLKQSIRGKEKLKEILRTMMNKLSLFDPFLWLAYSRTTLIMTKTVDTQNALPWPFRKGAVVYPEIGVDQMSGLVPSKREPNEVLRLLFAGRLLGWKGAHLAIRALAGALRMGIRAELTVVGKGPYERELRKLVSLNSLDNSVIWLGHLPQEKLFQLYGDMHCFIFPSLHDSSGNVVLEAQAHGLPVICLDVGGPAALVSPESAIVVAVADLTEDEVVAKLAEAIKVLARGETLRIHMANAAIEHAKSMSWESRVNNALALLQQTV